VAGLPRDGSAGPDRAEETVRNAFRGIVLNIAGKPTPATNQQKLQIRPKRQNILKALPVEISPLRRALAGRLAAAGIDNAVKEADWLIEEVSGLGRAYLLAHGDHRLTGRQGDWLADAVRRRLKREPLQYILGTTSFYGREFSVTPSVLIPRPETELLVEKALEGLPGGAHVLEVGAGSGCVAISLALERPDLKVSAVDISEDALKVARQNAAELGAGVLFYTGDVFEDDWIKGPDASLDLLVSNPPYVPLEDQPELEPELAFEPSQALFVENGPGPFIERLGLVGCRLLKPGGRLMIETHAPEAEASLEYLRIQGYRDPHTVEDLSRRPRVLVGTR
jgi:release factor glutamine methyltransferase